VGAQMRRYQDALESRKREFGSDREQRGWYRTLQNQIRIIQREPGDDWFAEPARADECGQRRSANER
jgi:hypothetical protein